uniref:hypothetical protein n=1 Tax=Pedobacter jeongneungensis TaxID=947309 RepID=UPI0019630226
SYSRTRQQELKQFIGTWEMEISNASFFATLKPRGILVSYAILCAKYEQFCGDVVFGANRKPVVAQLLAKREESCFLQHLDWQGNRKIPNRDTGRFR